jgi:hypothetical protein
LGCDLTFACAFLLLFGSIVLGANEEAKHAWEYLVEHSDHFMVDRKQRERKELKTGMSF